MVHGTGGRGQGQKAGATSSGTLQSGAAIPAESSALMLDRIWYGVTTHDAKLDTLGCAADLGPSRSLELRNKLCLGAARALTVAAFKGCLQVGEVQSLCTWYSSHLISGHFLASSSAH